ncbi:MAG: nucleotide exchange factor GrpE [Lachnospiraceae bacterium]|nr:nucleotide exchange factor GrpE [Lachnospiraceae bacterium]
MDEQEKVLTEETDDTEIENHDDSEVTQAEPENEEVKPKAFKKKSKPDKQKERITTLEDRVMRQMAEFENFRKRTEKEKSQMFETGARSIIEKILPVVDNFERGLAAIAEEEKDTSFAEGMNMIYKQLIMELDNLDVKAIPAVGEEFNPDLHNAVMQVESDEYETGIIAQEMQKGYTYRNTVVRYSMVGVTI